MKRVIGLFLIMVLVSNAFVFSAPLSKGVSESIESDFRGIWVATVLNLDYPNKSTQDPNVLKAEALEILNYAADAGFNAIVLQVRPTADAFYQSAIFPWSKYLTGKQGLAPKDGFDPLAFWIEEAHKRGIALHAWINPYRITRNGANDKKHDYSQLTNEHPARKNPSYVVEHSDGNLYFNPGIPEVRQLIIDGVMEIVKEYDVDGIHFDDYFYPGTQFEDAKTYQLYGKGFGRIEDWRRNNVDLLVAEVYRQIKREKPSVQFGISPFGIWANEKNQKGGSKTSGLESYFAHYADTKKWVEKEWLDYIAPQLYWHIGFEIADYKTLLNWWIDVTKSSKVKLYVGQGAYRVTTSDAKSPWFGTSEIERQLKMNGESKGVDGSIYFRYKSLRDQPQLTRLLAKHHQLKDNVPTFKGNLLVARPSGDVKTVSGNHYIGGASNPDLPLTVNGVSVSNRTSQGFFGVYLPLKQGENKIVIQNGNDKVTRIIQRVTPLSPKLSGDTPVTKYPSPGHVAIVKSDFTNGYASPSTSNGGQLFLSKGMMDTISTQSGNLLGLSSGIWVHEGDVEIKTNVAFNPVINRVQYAANSNEDVLSFEATKLPMVASAFNGRVLELTLYGMDQLPSISLPKNALVEVIHQTSKGKSVTLSLALKNPNALGGFYLESTKDGFKVTLKHKFQVKNASEPLKGAVIVIDPGHGGSDHGAIGLLGTHYSEKMVVLDLANALKKSLEKNGAKVYLTRSKDERLVLKDRLVYAQNIKPDLFLSIHADSASDTSDLTKVNGFSVFYQNNLSKTFAETLQNQTITRFNVNDRKMKNSNFYVTRNTIAPSVLIEAGFMSHPQEFQWLIHPNTHRRLSYVWADAIERYFTNGEVLNIINSPLTLLGH